MIAADGAAGETMGVEIEQVGTIAISRALAAEFSA